MPLLYLCPSSEVLLSNFNSYFELLVAFTFAYAGLKGFKEYINKVSFRDHEGILSERLGSIIDAIPKAAGPKSQALLTEIHSTTFDFNKKREEFVNIERICMGFYEGNYLQPMFFLVGQQYLFFLFLGGFQSQLGARIVFLTVGMAFLTILAYYAFVFFKLWSCTRKEIPLDNKKWLSSYVVLPVFGMLNLFFVVAATWLSKYINSGLPNWIKEDLPIGDGTPFCCGSKQLLESLGILASLSISIIPYAMYYYRERLFIAPLEKSFDSKKTLLDEKLNSLSNRASDVMSVIKPDAEN